jgi:hypothetical protein
MSAAVDGAGTLHIAWQLAGPGTSELHYQQRPGMPDTLLENSASTLQNPRLAVDAQNSVHLVYEQSRGTVLQARYRSWRQSRGWEARSTELTPASYSVAGPLPLPSMLGNLAVAYTAYLDDGAHFMVLDRVLQSPTPIASPVPREPAVIPARRFAVGPSPLRAGTPLQISETGASRASAPRVDFFDLAGRRIAAVELGRVGDQWRASIAAETTRGWSSGVYFARQRDDPTAIVRLVVLH